MSHNHPTSHERGAAADANRYAVANRAKLTGREFELGEEEVIVSKTDLAGRITYANDSFIRISGYSEDQLIGAPHSILRHPAMPRSVFKLLWDRIVVGQEVFAYVVNRSRLGNAYWVHAHVTATFGNDGQIIGYHSNRRCPAKSALDTIRPIYAALLAEEARHDDSKSGMDAASALLARTLSSRGMSYEEFVFSL